MSLDVSKCYYALKSGGLTEEAVATAQYCEADTNNLRLVHEVEA